MQVERKKKESRAVDPAQLETQPMEFDQDAEASEEEVTNQKGIKIIKGTFKAHDLKPKQPKTNGILHIPSACLGKHRSIFKFWLFGFLGGFEPS